jgi:hypothetical protein
MTNDSEFKADFVVRTAAQWTAMDPYLDKNDLGVESDTGKQKVGVGLKWSATEYLPMSSGFSDAVTFVDGNSNEHTVTVVNGVIVSWSGW